MKRTATIRLNSKDYTLCYSVRTLQAVNEKFGSPENMFEMITHGTSAVERTEAIVYVLHALIVSGAHFCILHGIDNPQPLSIGELRAVFPLFRLSEMEKLIKTTIMISSKLSVDVTPKPAKGKKKMPRLEPTADRYIWYGLHIGLDYNTVMTIPFGQLLSLINEEQLQSGTADVKYHNSDNDPIPDWE